MKTTLLFLSVFLSTTFFGQSEINILSNKIYCNPRAIGSSGILPTSDGGFIVYGGLDPVPVSSEDYTDFPNTLSNWQDGLIFKVNENFEMEWYHAVSGTEEITAYLDYSRVQSVIETPEGDFLLVGRISSGGGLWGENYIDGTRHNGIMSKISNEGDVLWVQCFDDGLFGFHGAYGFNQIIVDHDGNPLVTLSNEDADLAQALKFDWDGNITNLIFFPYLVSPGMNFGGAGIQLTSDGGYILKVSEYYTDYQFVKLDSNFDEVWAKNFGGSNDLNSLKIKPTNDGGFICVGSTSSIDGTLVEVPSYVTVNEWGEGISSDAYVLKLDSDGEIVWQYCYGGTSEEGYPSYYNDDDREAFNDVLETNDGGYLLCGTTKSANGDLLNINTPNIEVDEDGYVYIAHNVWFLKLDLNGNIQSQLCYGGIGSQRAHHLTKKQDGTFVNVSGINRGNGDDIIDCGDAASSVSYGFEDIWLINFSESGSSGLTELSNTSKNLTKIVDMMGRETSFKPNTPLIYVYDDGSTEKVFSVEY